MSKDDTEFRNCFVMLATPGPKTGAIDILLKALADPRVQSLIFHPGQPTENSPFARICFLLTEVLGVSDHQKA